MRKLTASLMVALLALALAGAHADGIDWQTNVGNTQAEAVHTGKPIMVDVCTAGSARCKKLDTDVYTSPCVISASRRFICVRLDAKHEGMKFAAQFKVQTYPTVVFLNADGSEIARIVGYQTANTFATMLTHAAGEAKRGPVVVKLNELAAPSNSMDDTIPTGLMGGLPDDPYANLSVNQGKDLISSMIVKDNLSDAGAVARSLRKNNPRADLGSIYNALGDATQLDHNLNGAWGWYSLTLQSSSTASCVSHADLQIGKYWKWYGDKDRAKTFLLAVTTLPDAPADDVSRAQALIAQLNQ